jgi:hypothetical protein
MAVALQRLTHQHFRNTVESLHGGMFWNFLEFAGNPELRDYFSRTQAGDECELTVTFANSAVGEETVEGSLKRVELPESAGAEPVDQRPAGAPGPNDALHEIGGLRVCGHLGQGLPEAVEAGQVADGQRFGVHAAGELLAGNLPGNH